MNMTWKLWKKYEQIKSINKDNILKSSGLYFTNAKPVQHLWSNHSNLSLLSDQITKAL